MGATATANTTNGASVIGNAGSAPGDPGLLFAVWDVTPAPVTEVRRPSACELCQACRWPRLRHRAQASAATPNGRLTVDALKRAAGVVLP